MFRFIFVLLSLLSTVTAFAPISGKKIVRVQPLFENFGLSFAEDAQENTLREIFGEVNYKSFVAKTVPDGLLVREFNVIDSIREQKLLKLTVESGLLQALEDKGLTLTQIEKLLPLADELNLLPLALKNKDLLLNLVAPLAVGQASLAIPLVVSLLQAPAGIFQGAGFALLATAGYEGISESNGLLAVVLILLGAPLTVLGSLLGQTISIPTVKASSSSASLAPVSISLSSVNSSNRPKFGAASAPSPKAVSSSVKVATTASGGSQNGKRKVIKIK